MTFQDFHLESRCNNEYVTLLNNYADGSYKSTAMAKKCGTQVNAGFVVISDGPYVTLQFASDQSQTFKGFNVSYFAQQLDTRESLTFWLV